MVLIITREPRSDARSISDFVVVTLLARYLPKIGPKLASNGVQPCCLSLNTSLIQEKPSLWILICQSGVQIRAQNQAFPALKRIIFEPEKLEY